MIPFQHQTSFHPTSLFENISKSHCHISLTKTLRSTENPTRSFIADNWTWSRCFVCIVAYRTAIDVHLLHAHWNYDSSVGIALGYGLDDQGSRVWFLAGAGDFSLHCCVQNGSGAYPAPMEWVPGDTSLGVKRPGREADHSPPSSAEVKEWVELHTHSPNTPSWCGAQLKHRDNFKSWYSI
jgi:hypothetical protein